MAACGFSTRILAAYEAAPHTRSAPVFRSVSRYRGRRAWKGRKVSKEKKPQVSFPLGCAFMPSAKGVHSPLSPCRTVDTPVWFRLRRVRKRSSGGVNYLRAPGNRPAVFVRRRFGWARRRRSREEGNAVESDEKCTGGESHSFNVLSRSGDDVSPVRRHRTG